MSKFLFFFLKKLQIWDFYNNYDYDYDCVYSKDRWISLVGAYKKS